MVEALRASVLGDVAHGFLGRRGGVSTGLYAGLNVGVGSDDEAAAVEENRRLAAAAVLPGATLVTVHQVHSAEVVAVTAPIPLAERPHADAMVTDRPGLLLGVLTADCAPVLFHDVSAGVVGAAHAGWKGALTGATEATIAAMEALGAKRANIAAAIGPCIAQASYEVDRDFVARLTNADPANAQFFRDGAPGHAQFDLAGYVEARLINAGIGKVGVIAEDTYTQPDRFYSFRRATHADEPGYGRQISLIGLG